MSSSRITLLITIALIAIASIWGIKFLKDSYKAFPGGPTLNPAVGPHAQWKEFNAPTGKFQVKLPIMPQQASDQVVDPLTKETRFYDMYVSQELDGTIYMISLITFKDPKATLNPNDLFKTTIDDMVKANPDNKLIKMSNGNFKNMPASNFQIQNSQMTIDGKTFLDQQTLYILSTIENNRTYNPEDFAYFLKSFELMK